MDYLRRKTDDFLQKWKQNPDRKPLVVKGPRQIGKTESIRKFGAENYEQVIEINFVEEPKYKQIVEEGYKTAEIIKIISRMDPSKKFVEGKTLLFFDELQEFPEISGSFLPIMRRMSESMRAGWIRRGFLMFFGRSRCSLRRIIRNFRFPRWLPGQDSRITEAV